MAESRLAYLFNKYVSNTCTREELTELWSLLKEVPEDQEFLMNEMQGLWNKERSGLLSSDTVDWNFLQQRMQAEMKTQAPVRRGNFRRRWWAAASILLVLAAGAYFWFSKNATEKTPIVQQPVDIAPGKEGAILTLADGTKVVLDSLGNGTVANERTTRIVLKNGQLIYETAQAQMNEEPVYNTMSTPKGRQFQLVLPDGTKAWLNAASSIRYPTFFAGDERRVEITGEVYFEVARSITASGAKQSFIVNVNDHAQIEVLGTHFNINAYSNEPLLKTTLLEGAVKVSAAGTSTILKPGEQAQINTNHTIQTNSQVDLDKVMAWKNGLFNFEETSLTEVMKQLERWYDITVIYEKGVPDIQFFGEISRNVSLADLIDVLKDVGVHFRIEAGRRLVVLP
jgi:transmembrane sensor